MTFWDDLQAVLVQPGRAETIRRGPKPIGEMPMARRIIKQRATEKRRMMKLENIAVLDMETDPFDKIRQDKIKPFAACLYRDDADPVIIWEENIDAFVSAVLAAIEGLPGTYTIYAHNGGKFDYMFLLHRLRGFVSFKGRGIMSAKIGRHEIRDSFHIIPERLANIQKDAFDYEKMRRGTRDQYRQEIISYLVNDCRYLLDVVKKFVSEFGLKLTFGQAAQAELKKHYVWERLGENQDAYIREYFFGGRCECLQGRGMFASNDGNKLSAYQLFDVNSMYSFVMATRSHPTGNKFTVRRGLPELQTAFVELNCRNFGALVKRGEDGEISADYSEGKFCTTIWEYDAAIKHGLIENVEILRCIDFGMRTDFAKFVLPTYARRQETKRQLKLLPFGTAAYFDMKKDDMFLKFLLNSGFGKFAQNPRRFTECYITDPNEIPPLDVCSPAVKEYSGKRPEHTNRVIMNEWGGLPATETDRYWIWERPTQHLRFNNVATAASITGAARAVLMDAIATADDPIYCDTDSLICRGLRGVEQHNENLGAWKCEADLDQIIIVGKKLYGYKVAGIADGQKGRVVVRSKGVQDVTWRDLERLLDDEMLPFVNPAPTFTKMGTQNYMTRNVRATSPLKTSRIVQRRAA